MHMKFYDYFVFLDWYDNDIYKYCVNTTYFYVENLHLNDRLP